jgi:uncharacterized protein
MKGSFKSALIGRDGMLRPIWRAAIFYAVGTGLIFPVLDRLFNFVAGSLHLRPGFTAANVGFGELLLNFSDALICTGAFALYERGRIDSYGLPIKRALGWQTLEGALAGLIMAGVVALGMIAFGGMQIEGFNGRGAELILFALAWMGANIMVGVAEEFWFRSYLQQTLSKSIGFWPASIVIALVFAAEHYFFKTGENLWDVITLVSISLLLSYSLLRTGTSWFAVGFHIAFDYMQLFVIGSPNGDRVPVGRLLTYAFRDRRGSAAECSAPKRAS